MRVKGLEPPRLAAPDPKSGASANFATPATTTKHNGFLGCGKPKTKLLSQWHCFGYGSADGNSRQDALTSSHQRA